jgi:hypothetical protein
MAFRQVSWLGPSTAVGGDEAFSRVSAQWRIRHRFKGLTLAVTTRDSHPLPFATFASLRLGENRRLNEEAHFSQRRKGAKWRQLFLKDHKPAPQRQATSA